MTVLPETNRMARELAEGAVRSLRDEAARPGCNCAGILLELAESFEEEMRNIKAVPMGQMAPHGECFARALVTYDEP